VTGDVYEKTQFDKMIQINLENEFNNSEKLKTEWEQKNTNDDKNKAVANMLVEKAMDEVRSLTDEGPLDKEQIKMDFKGRTAETKRLMSQKQQRISNLEKEKAGYLDISQRIESVVGPEKYDIEEIGTIEEDIKEAAGKGVVKLRELKGSNSAQERTIDHMYSKLAGLYKDKNVNIAGIFKGLDPIQHQAAGDADQYYYLYERTLYQKDTLSDMIRIYETQLANLERNKNDMIMQSYHHAMRLYEEIGKITKDSAINIEGRSRPVNMIKINLEEPEEKITGLDKMRKYIESCVIGLKDDTDKENKKEDIRRSINSQMSAWELLNVISDLSCLSIEAFKIDINVNNSRYKTWEQVMKENSGGERFVSFFAIMAALISYTRKSIRNDDFNAMDRGTKVIIMDNPFGPISSEHLLKPMFDIAKKYRTQLICLTGLKQNSILNCFNLVYMLRIRTSAFGTEEYIKIEGNIRDESSIQRDEKLEKAVFKASEYKQLELI